MNPDDLERLELKIAWLEQSAQELSEVLYRQQRELEQTKLRMTALERELDTFRTTAGSAQRAPADEKPPHY